ncbi:ATP-binding protein [Myxococcus sp. K15C18031901]|uniref:two-component regulator propeller domain-containing protein n=1 Tax=Myxococcus dinghuensis TaxID=2906761 RepID=UPI0020A6E94A|nr:two-component regulator propeller domain-containing protein [Myxococcus dinghuensis]MCP3102625.1 ATP-binding protein [Myxococcus dinghuensis]
MVNTGHRLRAVWRGFVGLVFVVGFVLARPGHALDPQRRVSQFSQDSWRSDDGLPQNSLLSLAQTRDGYLWLGTWEGLARFDGARFVVFDKRNTPELRNHTIKALAEDATGVLWVGTDQGLVTYANGRFERAPGASAPLEGVRVEELLVGEGVLWVGTTGGLWQVPLSGGVARQYTEVDGLPSSTITALAHAGGDNRLWVGTKAGVALMTGGQLEPHPFPVPGPDARPEVTALFRDAAGVLWMGTESGLVSWNGTVARRFTGVDGLPAGVTSLLSDSRGNLWVGTRRGGLVRRESDGFSSPLHGAGLADAEVLSLLEDRDGNLWVGTYSGLFRLRDGPFATYGIPEGLSNETVSTVLEDRGGTVWFGTVGGGLFRLRDGRIQHVDDFGGGADAVITALHEAPDGALWVGSNAGAFQYDGQRFVRTALTQGLPDDVVTAMLIDSHGSAWFGTRKGLARVRNGDVTVFGPRQGLIHPIIVMAEDASGAMWFGSEGGLWRHEEGKGLRRFTVKDGLPGEVVLALLADPDGTVWVGTESGLGRWREGAWTRYTVSQQGLYDDAVFSIVSDGDGHLWMSSNKGVSRVSRRELDDVADGKRSRLQAMGFDQRDGMRSAECNGNTQPSGWRGRDGRLWFTTIQGAIVVDPVRLSASRQAPEVRIEEVRVQGQPVEVVSPVELRPDGSRLDIRFTAFTPGDAARLPFRYRLVGHDDGWVKAEVRRATYTGLRPGRFRFEVQAEGRDGQWTEPVTLEVLLEPSLWQRTDFWALFVLGMGMLGVSVYLLRVGQLKARERWLEARVQERTRELARANEELESNVRTLRQTQAQLVQAGRMAAVGQLAAGVGHEINNPLAYIVSNLEHASEESDALAKELGDRRDAGPRLREVSQALREALHGADRVRRIVRDLKTFSRPDDEKQGPVELAEVLDSAVKIAMGELRPRAKVVRDYGDVTWVEGNEARLAQVFLNLLINAAQALPEGRAEENEVRLVTRAGPEGWAVAEVRDTGSGIAPESLGRIFDPFYTTKPVGVGTGLGLSLCHAYVTAMGGSISVESELGKGSVFRLMLRRAKEAPRSASDVLGRPRDSRPSLEANGRGVRERLSASGYPVMGNRSVTERPSSPTGIPTVGEASRTVTERVSSPTGIPTVGEASRAVTERVSSPTGIPTVDEHSRPGRAVTERTSGTMSAPVVSGSTGRAVTERTSGTTGVPVVPDTTGRAVTERTSGTTGVPVVPDTTGRAVTERTSGTTGVPMVSEERAGRSVTERTSGAMGVPAASVDTTGRFASESTSDPMRSVESTGRSVTQRTSGTMAYPSPAVAGTGRPETEQTSGAMGVPTTFLDAAGRSVTERTSEAMGVPTTFVDAAGRSVTEQTSGAMGVPTTFVDAAGRAATERTSGAMGTSSLSRDAAERAFGAAGVPSTPVDAAGRAVTERTSGTMGVPSVSMDSAGRAMTEPSPGAMGTPSLSRDAAERTFGAASVPPTSVDAAGRAVTERTSGTMGVPSVSMDSAGRPVAERTSGSMGVPSNQTSPAESAGVMGPPTVPTSFADRSVMTRTPGATGAPTELEVTGGHAVAERGSGAAGAPTVPMGAGGHSLTERTPGAMGAARGSIDAAERPVTERTSGAMAAGPLEPQRSRADSVAERGTGATGHAPSPEHSTARSLDDSAGTRAPQALAGSSAGHMTVSADATGRYVVERTLGVTEYPSVPLDAGGRSVTERTSGATGHPTVPTDATGHPVLERTVGATGYPTGPGVVEHASANHPAGARGDDPQGASMRSAHEHASVQSTGSEPWTSDWRPASSSPGAGAPPAVDTPPGGAAPVEAESPPRPVRGRVLVVDDDALVSGAIRRTLARENDVDVAVGARQALERLLQPEPPRYDVVLCDLMMPEMTGMDLYEALRRTVPAVAERVVFITGGAFTPTARNFLERVENPRVEKPFDPEALRGLIREEVARSRRESSGWAA